MQTNKNALNTLLLITCSSISIQTYAALPANAILQFNPGVVTFNSSGSAVIKSGSFFGLDTGGNGSVNPPERVSITPENGLILGSAQDASGSHGGAVSGVESPNIDKAWGFAGNTGMQYSLSPINIITNNNIVGGTITLDFSGWGVTWNGIPRIDLTKRAWDGNADGEAILTCSATCENGDTFNLDYSSTVPTGDPSNFGDVKFALHMEGTVFVPNTAPTANNVSISEAPAASYTWTPDVSDPESASQTLTCSIVSQPSNGAATIDNNGNCNNAGTYAPSAGASFTGTDSFTYKVNDGIADSSAATVNVAISSDPAPICPNISATANSNEASSFSLEIGNCNDAGGTSIINTTAAVTTPSTNGATISVDTSTQIATYTPAFGFSGIDTFTYTVSDSSSESAPATVTVNVNAKTGPPTIARGALSCGDTAGTVGATDCAITATEIGVEDNGNGTDQGVARSCIGGCFDFQVTGLNTSETQIVLTLGTAIPTPATGNSIVYRKLNTTGWSNFVTTGNNAVNSVEGTIAGSDIICPPASDLSYTGSGLSTGNRCLRLTITDGGPNDDDGLVNGTVIDPGGLSEVFFLDTRVAGSSGCSITNKQRNFSSHLDWLLLSIFIGMLSWFRIKRSKV